MTQEQEHRPEAVSDISSLIEEQQRPKEPAGDAPVTLLSKEQEQKPDEPVGDASTTVKPIEQQDQQRDAFETVKQEEQEQPNEPVGDASTTLKQEEVHEQQEPQEQTQEGAITYGDIFPDADSVQDGPLADQAVTMEDASLMQTAEAMAFGHTPKGGAGSVMQSAAAHNLTGGFVKKDAHSLVPEYGVSVTETAVPGAVLDVEYVAGQPVSANAKATPTDPAIASMDAITIGEALEAAAVGAGDRPIEDSDARAIESAERRATGVARPIKGGVGATAQSAAQLNKGVDKEYATTLSDVLMDATSDLPLDKVVTFEDAFKVTQAELRGRNVEDLQPGGVGATLIAAAGLNEQVGMIPPPPGSLAEARWEMESDGDDMKDDDDEMQEYRPVNTPDDFKNESQGEKLPLSPLGREKLSDIPADLSADLPKQTETVDEETTPLVRADTDSKLPSHGSAELPPPKHTEI